MVADWGTAAAAAVSAAAAAAADAAAAAAAAAGRHFVGPPAGLPAHWPEISHMEKTLG